MHVITRQRLNEFTTLHPEATPALGHWYRLMRSGSYRSFGELRAVFSSADQVSKLTVFNIAGNPFRLIAAIHHNRQRIAIRAVLTHEAYGTGRWKE